MQGIYFVYLQTNTGYLFCIFTDYSQIPGYIPITAAVPNWKKDMIEKKNQEKVEQYIVRMKSILTMSTGPLTQDQ
jgi:hypothetical protein